MEMGPMIIGIDERMYELASRFPTLQRTPRELFAPWQPERFAEFWVGGSGGEKDAALFVLSVWNPSTDWNEWVGLTRGGERGGIFDMHRALGNWDEKHREAFVAWARRPWWA
jgi:hypothetical protein